MLRRHLSDYNTLQVLVKSGYVQMQIHFLHIIPVWEPIRSRASGQTGIRTNGLLSPTRQLPQIAATQNLMPAAQCLFPRNAYQGNCIKLGQTHVRLPESGRGAPCGRPPQGITPTSLATGGRFLQKKTEGRPLWAPFSGQNAQNSADRSALSQILYVFGNWRPVSWPAKEDNW